MLKSLLKSLFRTDEQRPQLGELVSDTEIFPLMRQTELFSTNTLRSPHSSVSPPIKQEILTSLEVSDNLKSCSPQYVPPNDSSSRSQEASFDELVIVHPLSSEGQKINSSQNSGIFEKDSIYEFEPHRQLSHDLNFETPNSNSHSSDRTLLSPPGPYSSGYAESDRDHFEDRLMWPPSQDSLEALDKFNYVLYLEMEERLHGRRTTQVYSSHNLPEALPKTSSRPHKLRIKDLSSLDLRGGGELAHDSSIKPLTMNESFHDYFHSIGFNLYDVKTDGNCLFRAVADQIDCDEEKHAIYRKLAVDCIAKNLKRFEKFFFDPKLTFEEYLQQMSIPGTWGGNLELQALSDALLVSFCIHTGPHAYVLVTPDVPDKPKTLKVYHLIYFKEREHYGSARVSNLRDTNRPPLLLTFTKLGDLDKRVKSNRNLLELTSSEPQSRKRKASGNLRDLLLDEIASANFPISTNPGSDSGAQNPPQLETLCQPSFPLKRVKLTSPRTHEEKLNSALGSNQNPSTICCSPEPNLSHSPSHLESPNLILSESKPTDVMTQIPQAPDHIDACPQNNHPFEPSSFSDVPVCEDEVLLLERKKIDHSIFENEVKNSLEFIKIELSNCKYQYEKRIVNLEKSVHCLHKEIRSLQSQHLQTIQEKDSQISRLEREITTFNIRLTGLENHAMERLTEELSSLSLHIDDACLPNSLDSATTLQNAPHPAWRLSILK